MPKPYATFGFILVLAAFAASLKRFDIAVIEQVDKIVGFHSQSALFRGEFRDSEDMLRCLFPLKILPIGFNPENRG
jgi:hypothetical protein